MATPSGPDGGRGQRLAVLPATATAAGTRDPNRKTGACGPDHPGGADRRGRRGQHHCGSNPVPSHRQHGAARRGGCGYGVRVVAVWFGRSMMGAAALSGASKDVSDRTSGSRSRRQAGPGGPPFAAAAIGARLTGRAAPCAGADVGANTRLKTVQPPRRRAPPPAAGARPKLSRAGDIHYRAPPGGLVPRPARRPDLRLAATRSTAAAHWPPAPATGAEQPRAPGKPIGRLQNKSHGFRRK